MNKSLKVGIIALAAACGGFLSRAMGGGTPDFLPLPAQWFFAVPYGLILWGDWRGWLAYVACAVGARTAHYPYFAMGKLTTVDTSRVPHVDFLIKPFFGPILATGGQYWRCVAGLAVTGMAATIVPGILYGLKINPLGGAVIAFSGLLKPAGYIVGDWMEDLNITHSGNVPGEIGRGVTGWGILAWVILCF